MLIPDLKVSAHFLRRLVPIDSEDSAGDRVCEDPVPSGCGGGKPSGGVRVDRTEPTERDRLERIRNSVVEEREDRDGDLNGGADRSEPGVGGPDMPDGVAREEQVDKKIDPDLVEASATVTSSPTSACFSALGDVAGHAADAVVHTVGEDGVRDERHLRHPIVQIDHRNPPLRTGHRMPLGDRGFEEPLRPAFRDRRQP